MYNDISFFKIMKNSMKFYINMKDYNEYIMYVFIILQGRLRYDVDTHH